MADEEKKPVNRDPVDYDEKDRQVSNVYSASYVQNLDDYERNTDIVDEKTLYYTDLDVERHAELFLSASDAADKAGQQMRKFPNHIVKFFMFYYEEIKPEEFDTVSEFRELCTKYHITGDNDAEKEENFKKHFGINSDINFATYKKPIIITRICQCVPGTSADRPQPQTVKTKYWDYRNVKRKNLKKLYDKIDFIQIYRPMNTIKWYAVSKKDLQDELRVIREFYGLTNFPDTTGDFYFSKKIGKWLATEELMGLLDFWGDDIPIIYVDEIGDGSAYAVEHKTLFQILWEWLVKIFKGFGTFFSKFFGAFFNKDAWEKIFDFSDGDNNNIPDNIDRFLRLFEDNTDWDEVFPFKIGEIDDSNRGNQSIEEWYENIKRGVEEKLGGEGSIISRINTILGDFNNSLTDMIKEIKKLFTEQKDGWFTSIWTNLSSWFTIHHFNWFDN